MDHAADARRLCGSHGEGWSSLGEKSRWSERSMRSEEGEAEFGVEKGFRNGSVIDARVATRVRSGRVVAAMALRSAKGGKLGAGVSERLASRVREGQQGEGRERAGNRHVAIRDVLKPMTPFTPFIRRNQDVQELKEQFWWHGMKREIGNYIAKCDICQRSKQNINDPRDCCNHRFPNGSGIR
ncbi:hypothetical protein QYE76_055516 [Lolium multiflorum]|uniref:Integrase zinc-binding domain-containing protein n=1 Tax=Lolium multiflorum TaxID=4521 RepID=A0AAD8WLY6_LOLMU|nr:hypothetical protein QYE76_055516 [Lolium multiflorum]